MGRRLSRRIGPYLEIARAIRDNRDRPGYAWRILRDGVCDGCALGTRGLRDWTMRGVHLCWVRLNLLRLNTIPPFDPAVAADGRRLSAMSEAELRGLGRIPCPLRRRAGEAGFRPVPWDEALDLAARSCSATGPDGLAFYLVSRGTVNETYYVAQKVARLLGTPHIDNSARICHAPSTTGLSRAIGHAATTCSYSDVIGTDLVVLIGSDVANNQPVFVKYLHLAKKQGTRVAVVNPFREPGLERYFVPSNVDSALFGTRVADEYFRVRVGGDIAFLAGTMKIMLAERRVDEAFVSAHTSGLDALAASLQALSFDELERLSGTDRASMARFARLYGSARSAVLVWSMGVTMHAHGVANVQAIANLALLRGNVGRPKSGLMPIRGHSGVQGGAEMGAVPNAFPGGRPVGPETAREMSDLWGVPVPSRRGAFVAEMVEAAHERRLDVLWCVGSNLLGVLPDSAWVREAVGRIPLRVHHDIVLNPQMLVEPARDVLVLPATTRYELEGGGTETTTERRVVLSPEIPGPRVAGARDEWRVLAALAARVRPGQAGAVNWSGTPAIREEIARVVPAYGPIRALERGGDSFQWGGARLCEGGRFGTPDGRARLSAMRPPGDDLPAGRFRLSTRRGKQFNSMVLGRRDMLTGAGRDDVLMCREDMRRLGLASGARVTLRSETGEMRGAVRRADVVPGTVIVSWPEANAVIPRGVVDPECGIPAYRSAVVDVLAEP